MVEETSVFYTDIRLKEVQPHAPFPQYAWLIEPMWKPAQKLIDALVVGTVPIYWGDPTICERFDSEGIITFSSLQELHPILNMLCGSESSPCDCGAEDYEYRLDAVAANLITAKFYQCAEDWLWGHHRHLFE